jgi:3-hydroxypropanoate dehydrogenase
MRAVDQIFQDRTCSDFSDKPVETEVLVKIYDLMKLGPTSGNCCPLRIVFVQSKIEKEKLKKCLMEGNIAKTMAAPVTAIFAYDIKFYDQMGITNAVAPQLQSFFSSSEEVALDTAYRNSTLQAAYFIMIARGAGLDCGPMSGFDKQALDKEFFSDTNFKSNFICNLGYKSQENKYNRLPRLNFDQCCKII